MPESGYCLWTRNILFTSLVRPLLSEKDTMLAAPVAGHHHFQCMNTGSASYGAALCLPNTTRTGLLSWTQSHTHTHLAHLRPQRNLSFPAQLSQCFSREKGFQWALPGQSKPMGSPGPFPCLQPTWQSWRSRGLLLLVPRSAMRMVCSKLTLLAVPGKFSGEEEISGFWCPAMCCWELFSASFWPMAHLHFPSVRRCLIWVCQHLLHMQNFERTYYLKTFFAQFYCPHLLWSVQSDACFTVKKYFGVKRTPQNPIRCTPLYIVIPFCCNQAQFLDFLTPQIRFRSSLSLC